MSKLKRKFIDIKISPLLPPMKHNFTKSHHHDNTILALVNLV